MSIGNELNEMFCGAAVAAGALLSPDWETKKLPVKLGRGYETTNPIAVGPIDGEVYQEVPPLLGS